MIITITIAVCIYTTLITYAHASVPKKDKPTVHIRIHAPSTKEANVEQHVADYQI